MFGSLPAGSQPAGQARPASRPAAQTSESPADCIMMHHEDEESKESYGAQWKVMEDMMDEGKTLSLGIRADKLTWARAAH